MSLIIDPPVSPYSPPAKIRAWLTELRARLPKERDPDNVAAIERSIADAERMLSLQEDGPRD